MGKVIVSNNIAWLKELSDLFRGHQLKVSFSDSFITSFHKIKILNDNSISKNGLSVVCTGTWCYKGLGGKGGLEALIDDISCGVGVEDIRNKMRGCYALVIEDGKTIKVTVDETHSYALYYSKDEMGNYIVSNTYIHVAKCLGKKLDIDNYAIKAAAMGMNSNITPFEDVFRLMENEIFEYDIEAGTIKINQCGIKLNKANIDFRSFEDVISGLNNRIEEVATELCSISKKRFVFLTGGVDSRLYLALDQYLGNDCICGYWKGSDIITNGTDSDAAVNKQIAEKCGIKSKIFDVSECFELDRQDELDDYAERYGEYFSIYACNKKWFQLFEQGLLDYAEYIEFGYMGETIRENGSISSSMKSDSTYGDFIHNVLLRSQYFNKLLAKEKLLDFIFSDLIYCQYNDKHIEDILDVDTADRLFNYKRLDMDNIVMNYVNLFYYSYTPLLDKNIFHYINCIPYELKKDDRLPLSLISQWQPELLKIPFFSHHHYMKFDESKCVLRSSRAYYLLHRIKNKIVDWKIYKLLYTFIYLKNNKNKGDINRIKRLCIDHFKLGGSFELLKDYKTEGIDVAGLAELVILDIYMRKYSMWFEKH